MILKEKPDIVTGSGTGIGKVIAPMFAKEGAEDNALAPLQSTV